MTTPRKATARRARLPTAVIALGMTSLFTDVASDMIVPLLPAFLVSMNASAAMIGLVDGAAEATASFVKLGSGWLADRMPRKKPLVLFGYGVAAVVRPLMAFATLPVHVLTIRVVDRIGKGVRTAPRDVMLAAAAAPGETGRAFGFHRAMDHAGGVLGPLAAAGLLALGWQVRDVFWAAWVPGVIAVLFVLVVREPASVPLPESSAAKEVPVDVADRAAVTAATSATTSSFRRYLVILAIFALGNASDAFLLLRARDLGVSITAIPLLWGALHVSKVVSSSLAGDLSDRMPRARLIAIGWMVYAASYLALGLAGQAWQVWVIFIVYGAHHGLTEPAEKALVKDLAPEGARGKAFGLYHFVIGVTAIPAGLLTGLLWDAFDPFVALATGAALSGVSAMLILGWEAQRATDAARDSR